MTDSNLIPQDENTVPEGAFGIGSKETDDFTENERLKNFGIKDIPKAIFDQLKSNSGAIVVPNQITEKTLEDAAKFQDEFLKPRSEEEATALRATAAGIVDIPNEIKHLSDYLQGNPYDPNELIDLKALGLEKEGDMDNAAYQVFKFGGGFLIPYAGFNKALKGITGIKALQGIKNYDKIATGARWFTASSAADFVAIDKFDENLFNFLADVESPVVNNRFVRPIVEYLSAPERGEGADYGEAAFKSFLANSLFFEAVPVAGGELIKRVPKLKKTLDPYAVRLIDNITGGPNILNQKQMLDRTVQLFKDIKNDPTRLEFAKTQIRRLNKATLVGSEEFSPEFVKTLDDAPDLNKIATPKTKVKSKTKTKATDLPLQKSKANPNVWGDVEAITEDVWETTGKALNRVVIPDDFSIEAASAMGYDELLPKVIQIAKKISPNDPEKHMRVIYLGAIKEQKRLAKNVTQYMNDIEQSFMLGENISDDLLQNWSEDIVRMINLAGPTKKISNETAGTVRINQLIDAEPKDVSRIPVDEQVKKGIGGGEKTVDRAKREKFQTTTRELVDKTRKQISEQKLVPTKEELYEGMQTYIKNNDIEGLLAITRKIMAMQGDSKRLSKVVKGMSFGDVVGKGLRVSNEIFINSLLSAPETQAINIIGSLFNVALGPVDLFAGSPVDDFSMKIRAGRELATMFTTLKDNLTAAGKSLWLDKNILDERRMFGQDAYERYAIKMMGDNFMAKSVNFFGHGFRLPSRFMMAGDEFIKQTAFRSHLMGELTQQAAEKGLKGKSFSIYVNSNFDEIIDIVNTKSFTKGQDTAFPDFVPNENILDSYTRALDYSADRTFTTELGKGFGFSGRGSKYTKQLASVLKASYLKPIVPFVTTPVNIGKQVMRRTGLPDFDTMFRGMPPEYNATLGRILKEHNDNLLSDDLATAYRANGEATTGAAIWGYFISLAAAKDDPEAELALIGGGHHNRWLREGEKRTDELPYSFRLLQKDKDGNVIRGDNGLPNYEYIDFLSRMEPIGSLLMIAGDMAYIRDFEADEDYENSAHALTALLSRNLNNKYMIQNIAQMFDLTSDVGALQRFYQIPANYVSAIRNYPLSLQRSITRARGENWYDEITKKTYTGRFPKKKSKFRKGDLNPQEERINDIGQYEGNDFGSLKLSNNPFQDLDTFGLMLMRSKQDTTAGFSADIEPIRSMTTGRIAEYPEGALFGNYFNPFKFKKEKDNPVDEYIRRIDLRLTPPLDTISFNKYGNEVNLTTPQYNKLIGYLAHMKISYNAKDQPFFDPKNGKRFPEAIIELSRNKKNIAALKQLESDSTGSIDAQALLTRKKIIKTELQKPVKKLWKDYKRIAVEYYKEYVMDKKTKTMAENENTRAKKDIIPIFQNPSGKY